jgi:hypothetical protein
MPDFDSVPSRTLFAEIRLSRLKKPSAFDTFTHIASQAGLDILAITEATRLAFFTFPKDHAVCRAFLRDFLLSTEGTDAGLRSMRPSVIVSVRGRIPRRASSPPAQSGFPRFWELWRHLRRCLRSYPTGTVRATRNLKLL